MCLHRAHEPRLDGQKLRAVFAGVAQVFLAAVHVQQCVLGASKSAAAFDQHRAAVDPHHAAREFARASSREREAVASVASLIDPHQLAREVCGTCRDALATLIAWVDSQLENARFRNYDSCRRETHAAEAPQQRGSAYFRAREAGVPREAGGSDCEQSKVLLELSLSDVIEVGYTQ
jgi:hypothetical protein